MIAASLVKEIKLLLRDLHGLAVLFVMPLVFMLIMSVALSREDDPYADSRIAVVGAADNPINADLSARLRGHYLTVTLLPESALAAAQQDLQHGVYQLVLHNPNPAEGTLTQEAALTLLLPPDTDAAWLSAVEGLLRQQYTELRLQAYFDDEGRSGEPVPALPPALRQTVNDALHDTLGQRFAAVGDYLADERFATQYLSRSGAVEKPNSVQHSVPAWLVFGMFFIMIPLSNVMALERQTNTITRLRLARAPAGMLLLAKLLPYYLINQLQFVLMLLLGRYLLPHLGVPPLTLSGAWWLYALLAAAISLAALGYALLVSVAAKSTEHAVVLGGGGIIIMAALGGIMVPAYVMPPLMQSLTQVSPMAWGLNAFHALLLNRAGLEGIGFHLQLLLLFAAVCLGAAGWLYRRQLTTQVRF